MIDVFTLKRIFPDCPFKSNQRLTKISILTPWCASWLRGVMHTAELDSAVGCTPHSLTLQCDVHRGVWLCGVMHTVEPDSAVWCTAKIFEKFGAVYSAVWCTPRSLTLRWVAHRGVRLIQKCQFFVFLYLLRLSTLFYWKTSQVKKLP